MHTFSTAALFAIFLVAVPSSLVGASPFASPQAATNAAPQTAETPAPQSAATAGSSSSYWLSSIKRQGTVPFGGSSSYTIFRNVKDFGAKGESQLLL